MALRGMRSLWPFPGRLRSGLGAGFLHCQCWGLPRLRLQEPTAEEMALRSLELSGKVIYDIGADTGVFTLFFSRQAGARGHVVAFEPVAANCAAIRRNLRLNRIENVTLVPLGLGAAVEERAVVAATAASGRVSMMPSGRDARYHAAGSIHVEPLETLMWDRNLPAPDFLKLDVEGAELEVLHGAAGLLQQRRPALCIELHGHGPAGKAAQAQRVCAFLDTLGYAQFHVETAARVQPNGFVPGCGHLLCLAASPRPFPTPVRQN